MLQHARRWSSAAALRRTALYDLHVANRGIMVDFAGWSLPVSYKGVSILDSILHTRRDHAASVFDVGHMCQLRLEGAEREAFLQHVTTARIKSLAVGQGRYALLTNENGGILDDCVITNKGDHHLIVVNAACRDQDIEHLIQQLNVLKNTAGEFDCAMEELDRALIAVQGPGSATILSKALGASIDTLAFFGAMDVPFEGTIANVARCGYTGEDGFEVAVAADKAQILAEALLGQEHVQLAGLAARDALRLEAGLCLYGQDLTPEINPMEAGLGWAVRKKGPPFLGAEKIWAVEPNALTKTRVGLLVDKTPLREGHALQDSTGATVGRVTSGGFSPHLQRPIAMAYVDPASADVGTELIGCIGSRRVLATVTSMPFVPTKYHAA